MHEISIEGDARCSTGISENYDSTPRSPAPSPRVTTSDVLPDAGVEENKTQFGSEAGDHHSQSASHLRQDETSRCSAAFVLATVCLDVAVVSVVSRLDCFHDLFRLQLHAR